MAWWEEEASFKPQPCPAVEHQVKSLTSVQTSNHLCPEYYLREMLGIEHRLNATLTLEEIGSWMQREGQDHWVVAGAKRSK